MNPANWGIEFIQSCQQNRFPLLFIDKMTTIEPGVSAEAIKNFSYNEWFFPPHFADDPNVPGFVQVECLAQTFIMTFLTIEKYRGEKTSFVSINDVKFSRKLIPGDTLRIHAQLDSFRFGIAKGSVKSWVEDEPAAEAQMVVAIPSILERMRPSTERPTAAAGPAES